MPREHRSTQLPLYSGYLTSDRHSRNRRCYLLVIFHADYRPSSRAPGQFSASVPSVRDDLSTFDVRNSATTTIEPRDEKCNRTVCLDSETRAEDEISGRKRRGAGLTAVIVLRSVCRVNGLPSGVRAVTMPDIALLTKIIRRSHD